MSLDNKVILVTGGTGSFGKKFTEIVLKRFRPKKLIIFSRDELKQHEMRQQFPDTGDLPMRYFIGDVRDESRLHEAFHNVDYVVHAAALKQVPACEYNPFEAVKTNVLGAQNIIRAAINQGVKKVIALSTDKAANPINLYGATKLCSDKLFVAGNAMSGESSTRFSVVRYGNVLGSRGSVIPFFLERRHEGILPVTDERMTRFWISLADAVNFVLARFGTMFGGEMFVPKIPSCRILDLANAIAPHAEVKIIGIRPGEKLHEVLISTDDARQTLEFDRYYLIQPNFDWWQSKRQSLKDGGRPCQDHFTYTSDLNPDWLQIEDLRKLIRRFSGDG
jgi:UDP-N-acetylglucosamine 4,6-dehydratase/5-epimerase